MYVYICNQFSLALDSTTEQNGCIRYIAGTGKDKVLREHVPVGKNREESHAIAIEVGEKEVVSYAEVKRGSISMHDEYVVHGSGGNNSPGKRRTYVIAFRVKDTVRRERSANFTHSHNDVINWDVFNRWGSSSSGSATTTTATATATASTATATESQVKKEVSEERARQIRDHQAALERHNAMLRDEQERAAQMEEDIRQAAFSAQEERERLVREHQITQEREEQRLVALQRQQQQREEEKRRRQEGDDEEEDLL